MADIITELSLALVQSFRNLGFEAVRVIPGLLGALILLIVGIALGIVLKRIVTEAIRHTKIDEWLHERKLKAAIGDREVAGLVGSFTKWYVIAIFLTQAVELIQMQFLRQFTSFVIELINKGIAGLVLLILGLLLARYVRHVVEATEYRYKKTLAVLAEFLVAYVSVVIALQTVGVNTAILIDAFRIGFTVLAFAIAVIAGVFLALAFRKELAGVISDIRKEFGK